MADDKAEKALIKDISRLIDKHGLAAGKTTIKVGPGKSTGPDAIVCQPPQVPTQITITLADGTRVVTTICK